MNEQVSELFWSASVEELKRGYVHQAATDSFVCLICGRSFMKGVIYREEETFYEAEKYASVHLRKEHTSMLDYLLQLNKKLTGLTDLQKSLLDMFRRGLSDSEIVKELGGGSTSTIRHHRFTLREKEKQAKLFLAVMELAQPKPGPAERLISVHRTAAAPIDDRYAITEKENEEILKHYFRHGLDGPLDSFPKKEKRKISVLKHIAGKFDPAKKYSEKEVNAVLKTVFDDYTTLRRYLVEYGFMDRLDDGSLYWLKM